MEKMNYYNENKNVNEEIPYDERLKFYCGELYEIDKIILNKKYIKTKDDLSDNEIYDIPFKKLLTKHNHLDKYFYYRFGDVEYELYIYSFTKNRFDSNKGLILKCLEEDRHWGEVYKKYDKEEFKYKENKIFWRGTTTGREHRLGNRFDLIKNWYDKHEYIDIGFSSICQDKDNYKKYVKGIIELEYFLKYKYILSVEGNDKDSGLNWKLNSNSVVMMTKPRANSWLMEDKLIPNHHYILLKDDFSDLKEKYEWCENNQDKCEEIIKNAKGYMTQFFNVEREEKLQKNILDLYFSKVIPE